MGLKSEIMNSQNLELQGSQTLRLNCICEISGFFHGVVEIFALLGSYTVVVHSYLKRQ
jgi:hypothetical protein